MQDVVDNRFGAFILHSLFTCLFTMKALSGIITEALLLEKLGPAPKISAIAKFFGESVPTTWRRVKNGQLQPLPGDGNIRISLRSLVQFLNAK
jgi:hypothetical protein